MSGGLKEQWGVGDAAQVGPDAQSQDLKSAFEKAVDAMAEHLQYTAVNADRARQDPMASRGQALVPRYQDALKQVDAADPAKAKPAIDSLLADADSLGKDVAAFRSEIEKAVNEWQSRSGAYDGAVKQVEELSEWQHPKEGAVRALADAVRGQANDRAYDKAVSTHDQFLPKLQPIYEDLQKQKAAQQQYEPAVASLNPLLAQAAAPSFKKVEAKQSEIASSKTSMEALAQGKDFVAAVSASTALNERVGTYNEEVKQIQQAKDQYEQVAAGIQAKVQAAPNPSPFRKLEAMQAELSNGQKDMESSVQAEEFEQALQKASDLGSKADTYSEQVKQIQQAKDQYEQVASGVQSKLQAAPNPSPFKKLEAMQAELGNGQKDMESSVQSEEFEQALQKANDLGSKADTYSEQVKQIQQAKDQYEQVATGIQAKVQAAPNPSPFKKLEAMQAELGNGQKDMESSVQSEEFEQALQKANDLGSKADTYSEQVKQIQQAKDQYEQVASGVQSKLQAAPNPSPFKKLEAMQAELGSGQKDMESSVQAEEFEQALQKANDLGSKADTYSEQVKQIQQAKDQYDQVSGGIQTKLQSVPNPSPFKKLETMQAELSNGQKDMESSATAEEFEQALQKANDLGGKADSYSEQVKQIQQSKDQYEQVLGGVQGKLQSAPSPSPFKKLEAMQAELSNGKQDMESSATAEEFEQALQKANDLGTKADTYSEQVKQIQQAKDQYEQVLGGVQTKLQSAPSPSPFKKLEAMQAELSNGKQAMESSATAEEFEQALQKANDLGTKADSYSEQVKQIQQAKDQYEQVAGGLQTKLQSASNPSRFKKLEALQAELSNGQKDMEAAATTEEFEQALQKANDLGGKADTYSEQVKQIQQAKDQYEQVLGGLQGKLESACAPAPFKKVEAMQVDLSNGRKDMESSATAEEFEQALQKANDLSTRADACSSAVADLNRQKQDYDAALGQLEPKLEAAASPSPYPELEAMQQGLASGRQQMQAAATAEDFAQALEGSRDLGAKADTYAAELEKHHQAQAKSAADAPAGPPVVSGVDPKKVPAEGGPQLVITGTGFTGAIAVDFGGDAARIKATFKVDSDTQITATAPDSTKSYTPSSDLGIYVTTPLGTSPGGAGTPYVKFGDPLPEKEQVPPPVVGGVDPKKVPAEGGPSVVITGSGFTGATAVEFGGDAARIKAKFKVDSDTQITATAPDSTKSYTPSSDLGIYVTTPAGTSRGGAGTPYVKFGDPLPEKEQGPPVVVSGVTPKKVPAEGGPSVVITGSGFTGATVVAFGGDAAKIKAKFKVDSDTQITATAPDSTQSYTPSSDLGIYVTTPSGTSPGGAGTPYVRFGDAPGASGEAAASAAAADAYDAAQKAGQWLEAARALEKLKTDDIKERLAKLKSAELKKLRQAALAAPDLGQQSMVALLSQPDPKKPAAATGDDPDPRADGVSPTGEGPSRSDADKMAGDSLSTKEATQADREKQTDDSTTKAVGKAVEAGLKQFLKTSDGKRIQQAAEADFDKIPSSVPYIVGAALAGAAITGLAKTHGESPITESPDVPLPDIGSVKVKGKLTWEGPVDRPTKIEIVFTLEVPLGKRDPENKTPASDKEQIEKDKRKLQTDNDTFQPKKPPDGLPKISGDPAPPLGKGKGPSVLVGNFDVRNRPGRVAMDLDGMVQQIRKLSDGKTGRLQVVAYWNDPAADSEEEHRAKEGFTQDEQTENGATTVAALQKRLKPGFENRIASVTLQDRTGRKFGVSGSDAAQLGQHEVAVIFVP